MLETGQSYPINYQYKHLKAKILLIMIFEKNMMEKYESNF